MDEPRERPSKIDDLRKRLYIKEDKNILRRRHGILHDTEKTTPEAWEGSEKDKEKTPLLNKSPAFKKFFIGALIFFGFTLIIVLYQFIGGHNEVSADNIEINVLGNAYTAGGEELPLQIEVKNDNPVSLELADLVIEYPRGSGATGAETERLRQSLGTIGPNKNSIYNTTIVLYGEQGSTRTVRLTLEYRLRASNAIFTKEKDYIVNINSAPIALTVDAPVESNPNQEVTLKIHTALNATKEAEGILVSVDYPPGFKYSESTPKPVYGNNIWELGDLKTGEDKVIEVKGTLIGQDGEDRSFRIYGGTGEGADRSKVAVIYNSYLHTITLKKPFLETHIVINDSNEDEVAVDSNDNVTVQIPWANNLPSKILNAQITAKLSGNAYNPNAVTTTTGFFDSNSDSVVWDKNTVSGLASVEPGENGQVSFTFSPASLETPNHTFLNNPQIVIEVSIKGTESDAGNITSEVKGSERKVAKVTTDFQVAPVALYAAGPFTNSGPFPPKAGQTTTYTILWRLSNTSNRVTGAEVRTTLPSWVKWKGAISPTNANITFVEASREVIWKIGAVEQGAGRNGSTKEGGFQISFTPSSSQVGSTPQLITESKLSGQDSFTGVQIKSTRNYLTTKISSDPMFGGSSGQVQ